MKTKETHSPTPWIIDDIGGFMRGSDGRYILAFGSENSKIDKEFIVLAVNCHDDLLAACESLLERMRVNELGGEHDPLPYDKAAVAMAKAAVAKARGEPPRRERPAFKGPTCKGCYALGTACGKCEACLWEMQGGHAGKER